MTCKTHPDAPHGFDRNGSHSEDRYVCMCEHWEPPQPRALVLADELESFPLAAADHAAAELRRQYEEIEKLKRDMLHYKLAANAEAQLVDELTKENESLLKQALYVIEAWGRGCDKESYERDIDDAIAAIRARLTGDSLSPVANPTKKS
jgi:isochorismate hydrolase